jgi:hypothetical protein
MDLRKLFGSRPAARTGGPVESDLREAANWLDARNRENARHWALGEERRFEVDQERARMALVFRDGKRAVVPIQIIASFLPGENSVRWAWANDSVAAPLAEAASALRSYGEEHEATELVTPELRLSFEEAVKWSALAASRFGCEGLYRCLRDDHSTVFVGFGPPEFETKTGKPVAAEGLWARGRATDAFQAEALALVEAWDAEMFPIDRDFHRRSGARDDVDLDAMDAALDAKTLLFERHWRPKNDLWRPGSLSWPSDHDPDPYLPTVALPRRSGGCFVVRRLAAYRSRAYVIEAFDGRPKITDIDLDWGGGLVWIGPDG